MRTNDGARPPAAPGYVLVSPEMTTVLGGGPVTLAPLPPEPMSLSFDWGDPEQPARCCIDLAPALGAGAVAHRLVLVVQRSAFVRLGGALAADPATYHLPSALLGIARALEDSDRSGESQTVYRLAKSIELLCETMRLEASGALVPLTADRSLSSADTQRLIDARRMIDERWSERLTLERIARACGLNRAKLTSSFRTVFKCTIAEAIAEKRLGEASRMLLTTDLPVSSIGYRSGYQNNAAFSRAFSRRYGMPPSGFRSCGSVA